jgi:hypothetical protein
VERKVSATKSGGGFVVVVIVVLANAGGRSNPKLLQAKQTKPHPRSMPYTAGGRWQDFFSSTMLVIDADSQFLKQGGQRTYNIGRNANKVFVW